MREDIERRLHELERQLEAEPYRFDRKFLFRVLSMGHSQFAQYIGARGPNTQVNAACASTTQAVAIAGAGDAPAAQRPVRDIDGKALMIALAAMLTEIGEEIDPALESGPIQMPLFRADFLDKFYDTYPTQLGLLLESKFAAIVGNPPYVSFYAKRARTISESDRKYYKANYRMGSGRINTYCLFIERAFDLLAPSGTLGFIVPNTVLIMKSYEPLRKHLLENGWLKSIVDLSLKVFPEVEVPTCVLTVERRDSRGIQFPRKAKYFHFSGVVDIVYIKELRYSARYH